MAAEETERSDGWSSIVEEPRAAVAAAKLERLAGSPSEVEARRRALELIALRPGEIVVDVGAGSGLMTVEMARRVSPGGRVFAVDPSAPMLARARALASAAGVGPAVDCRVADGRQLPFGPAGFDAACCHWVLAHVDPAAAVVAELARVTRRGGRVMCVEIDWDTAMAHPGDPALGRRILSHNASRSVDGGVGRRLPAMMEKSGLADLTIEPLVTMDRGGGDRAWLTFLHERADNARDAGVIDETEARGWLEALDHGFAAGDFFFGFVQFAVVGRVPL